MIPAELMLNIFFFLLLGIIGFFIISISYLIRQVRKEDHKTTTADYYSKKERERWK